LGLRVISAVKLSSTPEEGGHVNYLPERGKGKIGQGNTDRETVHEKTRAPEASSRKTEKRKKEV